MSDFWATKGFGRGALAKFGSAPEQQAPEINRSCPADRDGGRSRGGKLKALNSLANCIHERDEEVSFGGGG